MQKIRVDEFKGSIIEFLEENNFIQVLFVYFSG